MLRGWNLRGCARRIKETKRSDYREVYATSKSGADARTAGNHKNQQHRNGARVVTLNNMADTLSALCGTSEVPTQHACSSKPFVHGTASGPIEAHEVRFASSGGSLHDTHNTIRPSSLVQHLHNETLFRRHKYLVAEMRDTSTYSSMFPVHSSYIRRRIYDDLPRGKSQPRRPFLLSRLCGG